VSGTIGRGEEGLEEGGPRDERGDALRRMREELAAGLGSPQKEIPPKYFYDQRGSELFERITQLPEYYPTRAERALLESWAPGWIADLEPRSLAELGSGSGEKTRILLEAMLRQVPGAVYVPIDISADFLADAAAALRAEYSSLEVRAVAADITEGFRLPPDLPRPTVVALLGGTIGNFQPDQAARLLRRVRGVLRGGDRFLMGADLEKEVAVLEAAYNDGEGVTAEFNLNVLRVLNREIGADFDLDCFRHRAFYNLSEHRIEMHLVACRSHTVSIPGAGSFEFAEGETIRTEISCKFDRGRVEELFRAGGFELEEWVTGGNGFALAIGAPGTS
jgi:L-histidine Nalpha-methyltransferase